MIGVFCFIYLIYVLLTDPCFSFDTSDSMLICGGVILPILIVWDFCPVLDIGPV